MLRWHWDLLLVVVLGVHAAAASCATFGAPAASPPFSDAEVARMQGFMLANIQSSGAVMASPDEDVLTAGSYKNHWARDGALTMRTVLETMEANVTSQLMEQYLIWVQRIHSQRDPYGEDILAEPKFYLNGSVWGPNWCRPQFDGPPLRAVTVMAYATSFQQQKRLYPFIQRDLDFTAANWAGNTCDLWEDLQSTQLFWNRLASNRALLEGAMFAAALGDKTSAMRYAQAQTSVAATLLQFWNSASSYLMEEPVKRPEDAAVIAALCVSVGDSEATLFGATSEYVAGTVEHTIERACSLYPINTRNTPPGVLLGRYTADVYGGGNPWILTTAYLAQLFYRGSAAIALPATPLPSSSSAWARVLNVNKTVLLNRVSLSRAFLGAGDAVLTRLHGLVVAGQLHLSEQLDKNTGVLFSAYDLTWSYASVLSALSRRPSAASWG